MINSSEIVLLNAVGLLRRQRRTRHCTDDVQRYVQCATRFMSDGSRRQWLMGSLGWPEWIIINFIVLLNVA